MRAHYLQHVAFEGLGSIESWLESHGYALTCTQLFNSENLPSAESIPSIDLLIIMGGPMSVNDEGDYPWLTAEKQFVRQCIEAGKPVLGICLGAQMIAHTLGAKIFQNKEKEIGWLPIYSTSIFSANANSNSSPSLSPSSSPSSKSIFNFPLSTTVFHWHGETFDLPSGAIRLAHSEGCENQAFQYGERVIGLQFHLETTPESAQEIVSHCRHELVSSTYIQNEETILDANSQNYTTIHQLMGEVLTFLVRK